ncbi:MAG: arginase [Luteibaculum sp.]
MRRKVKIIEVPCDLGAGTRGASLGVDALRLEAASQNCLAYTEIPFQRVEANNSMVNHSDPTPNAHYIAGILDFYKQSAQAVNDALGKQEFPLVIAGDHSTAAGSIAGIKKKYPKKRLGVIWVDAHADIHSPYTTPSGNVHGMPLAVALQFDNKGEAINQLSEVELKHWEELKKVGGNEPKILPEDIVYIGVRDTEEQEDIIVERLKIPNISVRAARNLGMAATADKALSRLNDCDLIYVSFDVDSMDPSVSMGTGTPVPNGFSSEEAVELLGRLLDDPKVQCLEVVEINPLLDEKNKMAKAVLEILSDLFAW